MSAWIAFTVLAAFMQAVRTAGQKQISSSVSPMGATLTRYIFGLPFAVVYLLFVSHFTAFSLLSDALVNSRFVIYGLMAGVAQIIATVLLVKCFNFRNFTVGTSFAKTEAIRTASFTVRSVAPHFVVLAWPFVQGQDLPVTSMEGGVVTVDGRRFQLTPHADGRTRFAEV